jgi:hypothetical protein
VILLELGGHVKEIVEGLAVSGYSSSTSMGRTEAAVIRKPPAIIPCSYSKVHSQGRKPK